MNPCQAQEIWFKVKAFGEGVVIQKIENGIDKTWFDKEEIDISHLVTFPDMYRVKPEHPFKYDQSYWKIDTHGKIISSIWTDHSLDQAAYDIGNAYHTYEEAQVARDRQIARVRVERRIKELSQNDPRVFHFRLRTETGKVHLDDFCSLNLHTCSNLRGSKKAIQQAIKEMPEDIMLAMGWVNADE